MAGEGGAGHPAALQKKSSTSPACQAFTGQLHSRTVSPCKLYSAGWRQDTKLPGFLSCLFYCLWVSDISQHHMRVLQEFSSPPFPTGCPSPAPLPRQLPYGHGSLQREGGDVTHGTPCFCPSDAGILCQAPPSVSSCRFPNGSRDCAIKDTVCRFSLAFLCHFCLCSRLAEQREQRKVTKPTTAHAGVRREIGFLLQNINNFERAVSGSEAAGSQW